MGVVYAATHPTRGEVALKLLLTPTVSDPSAVERFAREAEAVARLDHPGLVRVLDAGRDGSTPYVAMRFVAGEPLDVRLRHGPLAQEEAALLAEGLARALVHAHERGVVHRDVKPRNVIVDPTGAAVLVDFGLARVTRADRLTATGDLIGTPSYMAPEQASGGPSSKIGPQADVYGLGATLYEMLAGAPPFVGPTVVNVLSKVLADRPAPPSRAQPGLDPALERLVLACLEKDPAARPAMDELATTLAAWSRSRSRPRRGRAARHSGRARARLASAALAGLAVAAIAIAIAVSGEPPPAQPPVSLPPPAPPPASLPPVQVSEPTSEPTSSESPPATDPAGMLLTFQEAQALCLQAAERLDAQDIAAAAALLDEAEKVQPECIDLWVTRSMLHHALGDLEAADAALERAQRCLDPTKSPMQLAMMRAQLLLRSKRPHDSIPHLLEVYRALPDPPAQLCFQLGVALRDAARPSEAIEPLRRAADSGQIGWQAHFYLAGALRSCTRLDEAIREYRLTREAPGYGGYFAQLREGETQLESGRPAEALDVLRSVDVRDNPEIVDNPQFCSALAQALVRTGDPVEGLRCADLGLAKDPAWVRAHIARIEALIALGRLDEARASLAAARELKLDDADVVRLSRELGP